jgi:hypothetical protein
VPHWSHRSEPSLSVVDGAEEKRAEENGAEGTPPSPGPWRFSHPALLGVALLTVVSDPGEEILFVGEVAPWLEALAPLLGSRARRLADLETLWPSIGPRTRAVVLASDPDALAVLAETDVAVVLASGPVPEDFAGLSIDTLAITAGPDAPKDLLRRVAHVARILEAR